MCSRWLRRDHSKPTERVGLRARQASDRLPRERSVAHAWQTTSLARSLRFRSLAPPRKAVEDARLRPRLAVQQLERQPATVMPTVDYRSMRSVVAQPATEVSPLRWLKKVMREPPMIQHRAHGMLPRLLPPQPAAALSYSGIPPLVAPKLEARSAQTRQRNQERRLQAAMPLLSLCVPEHQLRPISPADRTALSTASLRAR